VSAQDAVSESVTQRGLGFIDKIGELAAAEGYGVKLEGNEKYVNDAKVEQADDAKIIIETLVPSQVTAELSAIDCQNLLNKSDIIALYGSNQHSAEAMVTANENLQKLGTGEGQVIGAGFDSGAVIKDAVRNGVFLGAITQAPFAMGEALVDTMVKAANGEAVEDIDTGCQWYTAENMENEDIAINLYD
jgi:ribose transport system substrate-binding protein